ncbi:MAG: efflux RND transporter periplasmic adaptor subunit [Proteobacteria bacterium]|nr:efflux RND transporter periplasmic adaptor subunit [Pseudomonadota bacterium]
MTKKTIIISSVVALLAVGIGGKAAGWWGSKGESLQVTTFEVTQRHIVETVNASGRIQPEEEVAISPEVSGEIIELAVYEGQLVKKGDLLLRINPDIYQSMMGRATASVNVAKSSVAQSEAQYLEAKSSYLRSQILHDKAVIAESEWESAQRMYRVAELSVESAKYQYASAINGLNEARDNLKRTIITAPIDGTVTGLVVERGERVVGTAQIAGTQLMNVARLSSMEVLVDVNENDIVRLHMHDTATVRVDAFLGHEFKAVVTEISHAAAGNLMSVNQVTNFQVKIRVLPESYADLVSESQLQPLRSGMTATVDIRTKKANNVWAVPIEAVTTRPDSADENQSNEVVFTIDKDKAHLVIVTTGIQDERYIQILSGIDSGMAVIQGPFDALSRKLEEGKSVEIKPDSEDSKED